MGRACGKTRIAMLVLGLGILALGQVYAYDNHDFQVWNTEAQEFKVNKASKITLEQEFRWGDNARDFYYQHYDVGYFYLLNKYFNFGGGFRYIKNKPADKFRDESSPFFAALMFWDAAGFSFTNRVRIEYRYYDYQKASWRFRNKFDLKFPWKFTRFQIQPIFSDEVLFNFQGFDFNENRLYGGIGFSLTKSLKGEICYMLRGTKNTGVSSWNETNVLSTKLKLAF